MRFNYRAMGPVLVGCALLTLSSCNSDNNEPNPGLPPTIQASLAAGSAYDIMKVPAMTIDGNLNDWANISAISMADDPANGRGSLNNSATVKLAWDDTYLYAAYHVTDTDIQAVQTLRDGPNIYNDDEVELYIDPQGDGSTATKMDSTDYQLLANVRNAVGDNRGDAAGGKDPSYNAASFLAKSVVNGTLDATANDVDYTVELRVSWSDLGVVPASGNFMRIDPAVGDRDGNPPPANTAEFDWAGLSVFNNPSAWKDVKLVNPAPVSAYDIVKVGGMNVDGSLSDWAGIAAISMADNSGRSGGVDNTAKVRLAWDPTYLYYAYDVTDTELLAVETARDASAIYKDDEVELYVDPARDSWTRTSMTPTDYQFLANVRDALGDNKGTDTGGKDASYNAASFLSKAVINGTLNASGTDVGYAIEGRIAWTDLGVTPAAGNFMRVDVAVGDRDGSAASTQEFDWAGLSLFNNPSAWKDVKLVVDASAPVAPTNLALTVVSSSQIDVSWTASSSNDVAKYKIYRSTSGTPTLYQTVTASPYHDTGLTNGSTYTYQVGAVDAAGNESPKTAPQSATAGSTQSGAGIPFGLWGLKPDTMANGTIWTGGVLTDKSHSSVMARLDSASRRSPRIGMWFQLVGGSQAPYMNGDSSFNLTNWKKTLDSSHAPDTLSDGRSIYYNDYLPYIQNGTFQGNVLIDDPAHFKPYPTRAQIEAMAAHSKRRFPALATAIRDRPTELEKQTGTAPFTQLDAGWGQYRSDRGKAATYRDDNIAAAKRLGLGLVLGINITNGDLFTERGVQHNVPPDSLLSWGSEFLKPGASDFVCGFYMWQTPDYQYFGHPNMTTLANKAKTHVAALCKRR